MRVLFLDVDGVLNNAKTKTRCCHYTGVDPELAKRFTDWLRTTDVKVVLSSTWRQHPEMWPCLHEAGVTWVDKTPDMRGQWNRPAERGDEIKAWLDKHPEVTAFAIIDDVAVLAEHHDRFVQTDYFVGITDAHIEQLRKLLP